MSVIPGRARRGRALEEEWRSFLGLPEPREGSLWDMEETGQQPVLDLDSIDSAPVPAPADTPVELPANPARPVQDAEPEAPLAVRLTDVQKTAEAAGCVDREAVRDLIVRFRGAAVTLAVSDEDREGLYSAGRQAAGFLVRLAQAGGEEALADTLRPDPAVGQATWTVACYEIGDLSPSSLRDFSSSTEAVATLADCGIPAHVAAELIVTNADGLRWTAMTRSGSSVSFQLLTAATGGASPGDAGATLRAARNRWEDRLLSWAANPGSGLEYLDPPEPVPAPQPAVAPAMPAGTGVYQFVAPPPALPAVGDIDVQARLGALEKHAVASASELLEVRGEVRHLRKAFRGARRDSKRLRQRVDGLEQEVSRLRQELSAASQRAVVAELGLSALTATLATAATQPAVAVPVPAPVHAVVVPEPTRASLVAGPRSGWALQRLREWCDRRLAQTGPSTRS